MPQLKWFVLVHLQDSQELSVEFSFASTLLADALLLLWG